MANENQLSSQGNWYNEWSNFPSELDAIPEMSDISTMEEINIVKKVNDYNFSGGTSPTEEELGKIENKIFNARKYNTLVSAILSVQEFVLNHVGGWIETFRANIIGDLGDDFETEKTLYGAIAHIQSIISEFKGNSNSAEDLTTISGAKKVLDSTISAFKGTTSSSANTETLNGAKNLLDETISDFETEYTETVSELYNSFVTNATTSTEMHDYLTGIVNDKIVIHYGDESDITASDYSEGTIILVPVED